MCPAVNKLYKDRPISVSNECSKRSDHQVVECKRNVVYKIPFKCGKCYVGQTGRCVNVRLKEHLANLKGRQLTHLALHCARCSMNMCSPVCNQTDILYVHPNQTTREIVEAWHISRLQSTCVSHPSIALNDKEIDLMNKM